MFDIGWSELVIVGIVALIVIGPRELPKTLRTLGQMMTKVRRMASEFQGQFNDAIREAELDELRREAEKLTNIKNPLGDLNPLDDVKSQIQSAVEGTNTETSAGTDTSSPDASAPETPPVSAGSEPDAKPESASTETPADTSSGGGRAA